MARSRRKRRKRAPKRGRSSSRPAFRVEDRHRSEEEGPSASQGEPLKISDALTEVAAPMLPEAPDFETYATAISLAVMAWNLPLLPPERRQAAKQGFFEEVLGDDPRIMEPFDEALSVLIERKLQLFPDLPNFIVSYEVYEDEDNYHLTVMSSPTGPPPEPVPRMSCLRGLVLLPLLAVLFGLFKLAELGLRALAWLVRALEGLGSWLRLRR